MPTKYTGRVFTILLVMYIALCAIYPRAPFSIFLPLQNEPASFQHNLRPGIDMVGGTSLIYEIEATDSAVTTTGLAEQVATALKRRVDPNGVLNLIWRPQGDTRLEIQMPLSGDSREADAIRQEFLAAQEALARYNVTPAQVIRFVENLEGEERQQQLAELAQGSEARQQLFDELVAAYENLQQARQSGTIPQIEAAERAYTQAKGRIEQTNLPIEQLQVALEAQPEIREQRLEELRLRNEGFEARQEALENYIAVFDRYQQVRDEIADTASLKRLLQGSGVLEFHILADTISPQVFEEYYERLRTVGPRPRAGDEFRWYQVDRPDIARNWQTYTGPDGNQYVLAHATGTESLDETDPEWGLTRATPTSDEMGGRAVAFDFDTMGARLMGELTGNNIGRPMAVTLDNRVVSIATIQDRISSSGRITGGTGGFTQAESTYLINTLNAGSLPAQLSETPVSERTVGPQLGEDNLRAGLIVCVVGLVVVAVFLIGYYYLAGFVAFLAVLVNIALILGAMAAMNATFTLPGIAGMILAVGMSVDANILIFERLREEQARGLSLRMALRNAYDRAFSAIVDANVTTGIVAAILYWFGSEEVAGFGLTLLIGLFASLFTALFVTKTVFGLMIDKAGLGDLGALPRTFPALHRALEPKIDWMGKAPIFGIVSVVLVAGGLACFAWAWRSGNVLDVEFAGGTSAQFELRSPTTIDEVREALASSEPSDPLFGAQVVSVESSTGARDRVYEVVVANPDQQVVTEAVVARLGDQLNMREPSQFAGHDLSFREAEGNVLHPIEAGMEELEDQAGTLPVDPSLLASHVGGVAIVMRDLEPMLTADAIMERVNQQRLGGAYRGEGLRGVIRMDAEVLPTENAAVVFITNDNYIYDGSNVDLVEVWRREMAAPVWEMVTDAIADPDELQKVTNIGSQVARDFQRNATIALVLSLLGITFYIWVRFGDLTSGVAAVVALLHDSLFCLAGIGYAHMLANTFIGEALLLESFRLNLTMVAAILTVMGFSINDTVVVFDRIRENRGKYGKLTRGVINEAINQTLSRTILTSLTTIVTIFVMYVYGGPAIHGFTFAMLVGIITGTYSSIAIASPILLWGRNQEEAPAAAPATA